MRLNCNINGSQYSLVVNSDKPLSLILKDLLVSFPENSQCQGSGCGNCLVLLNGNAVLSCLVPAFKINGASILTFEGFQKTRFCHDIEKAYAVVGNQPCPQCYSSKTMIIESILNKLDKEKQSKLSAFEYSNTNGHTAHNRTGLDEVNPQLIEREIGMSSCKCIETSEIEKIINVAYRYRSKRSARRT